MPDDLNLNERNLEELKEEQTSLFDNLGPEIEKEKEKTEEELKANEMIKEIIPGIEELKNINPEVLNKIDAQEKSITCPVEELVEVSKEFPKAGPILMHLKENITSRDIDEMSREEVIAGIKDLMSDEDSSLISSLIEQGIDLKEYYKGLILDPDNEFSTDMYDFDFEEEISRDLEPDDLSYIFKVSEKLYNDDVNIYELEGCEILPYFAKASVLDEKGKVLRDEAGVKLTQYVDEPQWPEWYKEGAACYNSFDDKFDTIEEAYNSELAYAKNILSTSLWRSADVTEAKELYLKENDGKFDRLGFRKFFTKYCEDRNIEPDSSNPDAYFSDTEKNIIVSGIKEEMLRATQEWREDKKAAEKAGKVFDERNPSEGLTWLDYLCSDYIQIAALASRDPKYEGCVYFHDLTDVDAIAYDLKRKYLEV